MTQSQPHSTSRITLSDAYDMLPLTSRTLEKRFRSLPFSIRNDRGTQCDWFIYDGDTPVGVVVYVDGRRTCLHTIGNHIDTEVIL